jgi:heat shock protein HslJ
MKKLLMALGCATILSLTSCNSTKTATTSLPLDMLTGTTWELTEVDGKAISSADYGNGAPTIMFSTDNKISGKGGCNSYGGSYNLNNEGGLNMSQIMSTKMYCENAKGEAKFMELLSIADAAKIEKDKLTLVRNVTSVLVFKPVAR